MKKENFLAELGNWSNHRALLWPALEATKHLNLPVLELGCGDGSTPYLREYCADNNLTLHSYDYNEAYAKLFNVTHTDWSDFHNISKQKWAVALVDESPGEHRRMSIAALINTEIIVVHDSEPKGWNSSDYQVRPLFSKFKHKFDLQSIKPGGAWATAVSNNFDVSKWKL